MQGIGWETYDLAKGFRPRFRVLFGRDFSPIRFYKHHFSPEGASVFWRPFWPFPGMGKEFIGPRPLERAPPKNWPPIPGRVGWFCFPLFGVWGGEPIFALGGLGKKTENPLHSPPQPSPERWGPFLLRALPESGNFFY
ncbi:MAG: hypothetical protein CM1200mP14_19330 [Gammaproteobacteria bacterium]|nr:MAG: hypothetical protein CM1200mP14_19330 [Gammaproteobacteria bacterium]